MADEINRVADIELETPQWFAAKQQSGMALGSDGMLRLGDGQVLSVPMAQAPYAAAYYRGSGQLLTVYPNGVVVFLRRKDDQFVEISRFEPDYEARTLAVRLTRHPALVYILCVDVAKAASLHSNPQEQDYSDRYHRICLSSALDSCDAVPLGSADEIFLQGFYVVRDGALEIDAGSGTAVTIQLTYGLATPFRSGPGDELAQSVFLFGSSGIVCRADLGWVVYTNRGQTHHWFPDSAEDVVRGGQEVQRVAA